MNMHNTWLLIKELAYITATASTWALMLSLPLLNHQMQRNRPVKPIPTSKTFITVTYLTGNERRTDSGWMSTHRNRIIKHAYLSKEQPKNICYTNEILTWNRITRK